MMNVVVLPYPLQGHLNPCLSIARLLVPKGFTFTFVVTEELAANLQHAASEGSSIQYATVASSSDGPLAAGLSALSSSLTTMHSMRPGVEGLLRKLTSSSARRVSCIIADSFVTWSQQVATQFNIPRFVLWTSNAHAFAVVLHSPSLVSQGLLPIQDLDLLLDSIPGLPPLHARDLPQSVRTLPDFAVAQVIDIHEAVGLILNTVYKLESKPLEAIRQKLPVYPIGPFLLMPGSSSSSDSKGTLGFWTEERSCLKWLDTMLPSSVLYVSFGSIATMGVEQMRELAEGLDASGHAFLWVLRPNASEDSLSNVLPEAFEERTRDKGLIITWAPQVEVLSHPSVGGFLTHCGWNSITENLSMGGVPMICWPHLAEQRLNSRLLVDELKIGLELQEEGGMVKRCVVEKAVKELMEGDVGRELRTRALQLKETAFLAVQEGGSSHNYLEALVQDMKRLALNLPA